MKISTRTILHAEEGMILTDGNTYGRVIMLGENRSTEEFHEITEEEYAEIMAEAQAEIETSVGEPTMSEVGSDATSEESQEEEVNGDNS